MTEIGSEGDSRMAPALWTTHTSTVRPTGTCNRIAATVLPQVPSRQQLASPARRSTAAAISRALEAQNNSARLPPQRPCGGPSILNDPLVRSLQRPRKSLQLLDGARAGTAQACTQQVALFGLSYLPDRALDFQGTFLGLYLPHLPKQLASTRAWSSLAGPAQPVACPSCPQCLPALLLPGARLLILHSFPRQPTARPGSTPLEFISRFCVRHPNFPPPSPARPPLTLVVAPLIGLDRPSRLRLLLSDLGPLPPDPSSTRQPSPPIVVIRIPSGSALP